MKKKQTKKALKIRFGKVKRCYFLLKPIFLLFFIDKIKIKYFSTAFKKEESFQSEEQYKIAQHTCLGTETVQGFRDRLGCLPF